MLFPFLNLAFSSCALVHFIIGYFVDCCLGKNPKELESKLVMNAKLQP